MMLYDVYYGRGSSDSNAPLDSAKGRFLAIARNTNWDGHRLYRAGGVWREWATLTDAQRGRLRARWPAMCPLAAAEG